MSGHEQDTDNTDSTPNANGPDGAAGGMGVSSERVGPTGDHQLGTDGLRDVGEHTDAENGDVENGGDARPEQSAGGPETNPDPPIPPVSGYNSLDPRSKEHPFLDED